MSRAFSSSIEMIIWFIYFICTCANGVYHIDWFADIESSLCSWDKSHLIWMYHPFNALFNLLILCWELFCLCLSVILAYWFYFYVLSLVLVSRWCWMHKIRLEVSWIHRFVFCHLQKDVDYGNRSSSYSSLATHDCLLSIFVLFEIFSVMCYLVIKNIKQKLLRTEERH